MSEDDLQLLITLDDPLDAQDEDIFHHLQAEKTVAHWHGQIDNDPSKVAFGQGDWTCTLARFTGTTNDSIKGLDGNMIQPTSKKFEIDVCTVAHWKNGEIVEEKLFRDLVGMLKQIGVM